MKIKLLRITMKNLETMLLGYLWNSLMQYMPNY
nr:MAG TPA: hypothetical protein [Caudoviricetes sp.]